MGCSSQKNAQVDEPDNNKKNNNKKDKKRKESPKKKETENESDEDDDFEEEEEEEEEEMEMDENGIEKLKKKHMINEYIFYPTKDIPKKRFVKKDIDKVLPSDFAGKEKSDKDKQYFCFQKKVNKNETKKYKFRPDDESEKNNNPIKDEIYHFNQHLKQAKTVRPLKREEIVKPYNYQYEYKLNEDDQLLEKKSNKGKEKYEYLDMFPNGEAYKFVNSDDEEENKKEKNKIDKAKIEREKENEAKKIELINQNDENNIANIINKELKENNLLEGDKKAVDNANDF